MTVNEIKKKLQELILQLPENKSGLLMIYDEETKDNVDTLGIGCIACAVELLMYMYATGYFKHNREEDDSHTNSIN